MQAGGKEGLIDASRRLADLLSDGDEGGLASATMPDFMFIDETGAIRPKGSNVPVVKGDPDKTKWSVQDYGTVAMVIGRAPAESGELITMDVFVRKDASEEWRALVHHLNMVADPASPLTHPQLVARSPDAPAPACENPLSFLPYEPKNTVERDIIKSFQTMERAVTRNDADTWVKHMADEFTVFRTRQHPTTKAERAAHLRNQKAVNAETFVAAIEAMRLWVFGDAAVMRADHVMPENRRPPYRATRVWVKRDGQWQMTVSQQTTRAT